MRGIMATKKIYLVDTENVGSTWKELLPAKANADQILLFFTDNSPYVSYNDLLIILQYPNQFEMIKCNPGKNGLDFQLVSYLGYLLKTASKSHYIIVSNDCGFDAVVKFWKDRGMSVTRSNVYHVLQPDAEVQQQPQTSFVQAEASKGKRGRYSFNEKRNSQNARRIHTSNKTAKIEKFVVGNTSEIISDSNSQEDQKALSNQPDNNFQKNNKILEQQTDSKLYADNKTSEQPQIDNIISENKVAGETLNDRAAVLNAETSQSLSSAALENAKTGSSLDNSMIENSNTSNFFNSTAPESSTTDKLQVNNLYNNTSTDFQTENIQTNNNLQLSDTSMPIDNESKNKNLFVENNSFNTLQPAADFADTFVSDTTQSDYIQENIPANNPFTTDVTSQAVLKKTAKRGRPKGSRSQSNKTKKASKLETELPETSDEVLEPDNIILDFSSLTVSEKAALLRKYLPDDFSESQESLDIISDIMFGHDTTNHHQLHLAFVKNFGDEKGTLIYKAFRPHLAEFRA